MIDCCFGVFENSVYGSYLIVTVQEKAFRMVEFIWFVDTKMRTSADIAWFIACVCFSFFCLHEIKLDSRAFFRKRINSTVILIGGVRSRWTIDLWNRKSNERIVHLSRTVTRSVLPMIYYRTFYTRRTFDLNQHPIKNAYSQSHTCINWLDWFDFDLNCAPNSID